MNSCVSLWKRPSCAKWRVPVVIGWKGRVCCARELRYANAPSCCCTEATRFASALLRGQTVGYRRTIEVNASPRLQVRVLNANSMLIMRCICGQISLLRVCGCKYPFKECPSQTVGLFTPSFLATIRADSVMAETQHTSGCESQTSRTAQADQLPSPHPGPQPPHDRYAFDAFPLAVNPLHHFVQQRYARSLGDPGVYSSKHTFYHYVSHCLRTAKSADRVEECPRRNWVQRIQGSYYSAYHNSVDSGMSKFNHSEPPLSTKAFSSHFIL